MITHSAFTEFCAMLKRELRDTAERVFAMLSHMERNGLIRYSDSNEPAWQFAVDINRIIPEFGARQRNRGLAAFEIEQKAIMRFAQTRPEHICFAAVVSFYCERDITATMQAARHQSGKTSYEQFIPFHVQDGRIAQTEKLFFARPYITPAIIAAAILTGRTAQAAHILRLLHKGRPIYCKTK